MFINVVSCCWGKRNITFTPTIQSVYDHINKDRASSSLTQAQWIWFHGDKRKRSMSLWKRLHCWGIDHKSINYIDSSTGCTSTPVIRFRNSRPRLLSDDYFAPAFVRSVGNTKERRLLLSRLSVDAGRGQTVSAGVGPPPQSQRGKSSQGCRASTTH